MALEPSLATVLVYFRPFWLYRQLNRKLSINGLVGSAQ
jgi:hypothetical protein